jgi:hypothetical protein
VQEEKVVSEGEYFGITTTTPQVAGKPFNVHIIAKDADGNQDTSYTGSVDIFAGFVQPVSGSKILTPDMSAPFVAGVSDMTLVYPDAGTIKVTVRDRGEPSKIGYSGDLLFLPDSFTVTSGPTQIVGKNFPLTVKALSADGQVTPNYQGPAMLEAVVVTPAGTSGGALNPAEVTSQFQNGTANVESSYNRWGSVTIKASDKDHPGQSGQSDVISFVPKSLSVNIKKPSASRDFFYANENMEVTLSVLADDGSPIENFQGTVSITSTPSLSVPASYIFSAADKGSKTFIVPAGTAGFYKLKMEDIGEGLSVESERIEVKDATIVISSTSAPIGTTRVTIQLVDSKGKRITSESEMKITIIIHEGGNIDASTIYKTGQPVLFKNGLASFVIGDKESVLTLNS